MKRAFALYGSQDLGKTTTLNFLIELIETGTTLKVENKKDKRVILKYKEFKIGICTPGDDKTAIIGNCSFFKENDCDIIFTARRTKGITKTYFENFCTENGYFLTNISKKITLENQTLANIEQAQSLLKLICQIPNLK